MSFRRRGAEARALPAGVAGAAGGARVVSSGVRGLDALLGGGVALGRLTVLVEDAGGASAAAVAVAAFCAQGVAHAHPVALATPAAPAADVLAALPAPADAAPAAAPPALDIAWRYARAPRAPAPERLPARFRVALDAGRARRPPAGARLSALGFPDARLGAAVGGVRAHCARAAAGGLVARAAVLSVGSPLWAWGADAADVHEALGALGAVARATGAAVLVTVPPHVAPAHAALSADAVVRFVAFDGPRGRWAGAATLEKAVRAAPGTWIGVRGAVAVFRRARRGLVLEDAAPEPEGPGAAEELPHAPQNGMASVCGAGPRAGELDF